MPQAPHNRSEAGRTAGADPVRRAVSVSIGSSRRDAVLETELLGRPVRLERRGTDGDLERAAALIRELDGKVDAIGLGGLDLYVVAAGRRYYLRDGVRLARQASVTPVVCGAGLKDTLERLVVEGLDRRLGWRGRRVLMVLAVDRYGMAEELARSGADIRYGDLAFSLGLPVLMGSMRQLDLAARSLLPIIRHLPVRWIYPVGKDQEQARADRRSRFFDWAEVIAGDFHYVKRYAPERLDGKVVLTNTTTAEDVEMLRGRGAAAVITTTPRLEGRSLPTNLLEAGLIAASGRHPLTAADYRAMILESGLEPDVQVLDRERFRLRAA